MAAKSGWFIGRRFEWKVVAGPPALALGRPAGRQGDPARRNHPQRVFWRQCTISDGGGTSFWFHSRTLNRHAVNSSCPCGEKPQTKQPNTIASRVTQLTSSLRVYGWQDGSKGMFGGASAAAEQTCASQPTTRDLKVARRVK